jgi:hypothetical protein
LAPTQSMYFLRDHMNGSTTTPTRSLFQCSFSDD